MAFDCRHWGVLPNSGGSLDQPAGLLTGMRKAENMYKAYTFISNAPAGKAAALSNQNPSAFKVFSALEMIYRDWRDSQNE